MYIIFFIINALMLIIALAFLFLSEESLGAILLAIFIMTPALLAFMSQIKSQSKHYRMLALIMNWGLISVLFFFVMFTIDNGQNAGEDLQGVVSALVFFFFILPFGFNIIYISKRKTIQRSQRQVSTKFYSAEIIDQNGVIERNYP
ncbi:MAG: hypothetical protein KAU26_05190 [Methylococcales bacterium]|nr:hypothetical protein [Methylococcales bacterium]